MTDTMHLRVGTDADGESFDALLAELSPGSYKAGSFRPSRFRSGTRTFIAETDGAVIGVLLGSYIDLGITYETSGYIDQLVVDRAHRNEHVGEALVGEWKSWLRAEGVALGFVSTTPDGPQAFYERCGFDRCNGPWLVWADQSVFGMTEEPRDTR